MMINRRCTTCQGRVSVAEIEICGECGRAIHSGCAEFEQRFECPRCAEEPEIGAVEF
ncbi:MAG: hypothetical protein ACOCPZ_02800 [Natrialbaceae archaeon]